jgi:hypothetical protein
MKPVSRTIVVVGAVLSSLAACAPTTYIRPGTPVQVANIDRAQCALFAQTTDPGYHDPNTGNWKANVALSVVDGISRGLTIAGNFRLCMEARGYEAVQAGANNVRQ